ncbi:MAG: flagellar biosynthesis protein FlhF [Lachnospiraceae bacterium]|nr:flagellar biosynthesis protein FlhF [Lachnospiraceae bacterium]
MIIKKFQGKTEEEAVKAAKKEMGENVVIMNVKNVKKKGLFSFLKPQIVEVTVALEENDRESRKQTVAKEEPKKVDLVIHNDIIKEPEAKESVAFEAEIGKRLDSLQSYLEQRLQLNEEERIEEEKEPEVESETMVFQKLLYNTMINNEVDEKYANEIIDEIEKINGQNATIDQLLESVYQRMVLKFGQTESITPATEGPKIIFFVGPTGVGKTTTIAKIASRFSLELRKKVALLTSDTYRIAAVEQLRTYANIMEVPFQVIYAPEELQEAIKNFNKFDYIFVDTAGHSPQNESQKEDIAAFICVAKEMAEIEVFLVMSATTKYRDLIAIADAYTKVTKYKLIFTKLDETSTLGNLLNVKLYSKAPMSYVTYGQNVPDDIDYFSVQSTVKQLLGGKKEDE